MKISNYSYGTNNYKNKSTKPEDYDFNAFSDSLVSNAMKRLEEAKSQAPKIDFGASASESIYDADVTDTNNNFLANSEPAATLREGARIKNDAYELLKNIYPESKTKGVFDNISDEEIEANIPKARELTQSAEKSNPGYSLNPFTQDAYSLYLASGMKGDKNATNLAYKLTHLQDMTKSSDNKNEGQSAGESVTKVDYATDNTPAPTPTNYSYDQNENKSRNIYENNPTANSRDENNPNIIFSEHIPVQERIYNSLVPDSKNCLTIDDKKKIYSIKNSEGVSTEHAKIMYFSEQWKDVPEVKWTMGDIAYWGTLGGEDFLHSKKISFIENYKDVIIDAAAKYDIPPLLVAGVAYIEFGGDPMFLDDMAYVGRTLAWSGPDWMDKIGITKNPDLTSYGNTSIQVRRAIEMLGYDKDTNKRNEIIKSLKDPIQNIYMTACHLDELRNIDFAGKSADELTEDENKIIASRYNIGPEPRKDQILTQYGQDIYDNKNDILNALTK